MKPQFLLIFLSLFFAIYPTFGQEVFIDSRDKKEYKTVTISGIKWMTENLDFETELSLSSDPQHQTNTRLSGRYYHLDEICCVCPDGWRLPGVEDWLSFFSYSLKSVDSLAPLKFIGNENHFAIDGYSENLNVFDDTNPLKLTPTGRVEGGKYNVQENYADYWTLDPPKWNHDLPPSTSNHAHVLSTVYEGKTHIHIRNKSFTNIHSHKHHLNPKKKGKLRMFMIRCVKTVD